MAANLPLTPGWQNLLTELSALGYYSAPKTPQQLVRERKHPLPNELLNFFALGLPQSPAQLLTAGLSPQSLELFMTTPEGLRSPWAISSGLNQELYLHSHWPPLPSTPYVHLGPESFYLARELQTRTNSKILDLGCGMGVLGWSCPPTTQITGIDISESAIEVAKFYQAFLNHSQAKFICGRVGSSELARSFTDQEFDLVVFNPPLAIPGDTPMIHRDGGVLGLEIPNLFLHYAHTKLKTGGEAWFIVGDPQVNGRWKMHDQLKAAAEWEIQDYQILEEFFNQGVARKHGYGLYQVEKINLVLIKVRKISS